MVGVRQVTNWDNCYEGGWQHLICREAYAHP